MHLRCLGFFVVVFFSVFSNFASASSLNLTAVISDSQKALKVQRVDSELEGLKWDRIDALSNFLPSVNIVGTRLFDKKYALVDVTLPGASSTLSIPQIIPTTSMTVNAQWTLFDGLANFQKWNSASALVRAGENAQSWSVFKNERESILLFYQALSSRTLKEVAEQNLKTLNDHLQDAKLFKKAGEGTDYEVLRVEVQQSEASSELLKAQDNIAISAYRLGELLGREIDSAELAGELPILNPEIVNGIKYEESGRSDLLAMQERAEGLARLESANSAFWVPRIGLFGQFSEYNNRSDRLAKSDDFRSSYAYGLSVSWNVFDGLSSIAKSRASVQKRVQAEKDVEIGKLKAKTDFEEWKRRFVYHCSVYRSRSNDVSKATESVRLARAGRKVGARTSTDLLDAELELFKARADLIHAQMGAIESLVYLELAMGKKIYDFR